jgi:hypothetical protein
MREGVQGPPASEAEPQPRRKAEVRWSEALGRKICRRVAAGELLCQVLRDDGMPTQTAVANWEAARPKFKKALLAARKAGGRPKGSRGPAFTYNEGVAREIYERLCLGESLLAISRDPTMPSRSTMHYWRRHVPAFAALIQTAREVQAELFCDLGIEMAMAATPETAYLTHVRLNQLRWTAGVLAPQTYRTRPAEAPVPPRESRYVFRSFRVEVDPVTGKDKVVAYCPNPYTGQVEREDTPGWRPPPDSALLAGKFLPDRDPES